MVPAYREDLFLSFLPLSHTLERTASYYLPMMVGARVAFARSLMQLGEDFRLIRPTCTFSILKYPEASVLAPNSGSDPTTITFAPITGLLESRSVMVPRTVW